MSWSHPSFEALAGLLGSRTGLVFIPDRRPGAELGIRRAMGRAGVDDPDRYRVMVAGSEPLLDDLLVELTVGETYFYREPKQFEFLRREVLPGFLASGEPVRAWSAGCASGEEAYTLAMLFTDAGLGERARVLATDISRAALARAGRAVYGAWSLRGDGAATALPHLKREDEQRYSVVESVRRLVRFEHLNLALDVYPSFATGTVRTDLILCRNVLIYFDRETVRAVVNRLAASLSEGGWLVTASSDPALGAEAGLEAVVTDFGVFYRRARPASVAVAGEFATGAAPVGTTPPTPLPPEEPGPRRPDPESRESVLAAARDDLARGRYSQAAERARPREDDPEACALLVRALANLDPVCAAKACAGSVSRHPLSEELHYLHAVLLVGLGLDDEAAEEARRVLYLDRSLAVAHFLLGSVLLRLDDRAGAWRAYRNTRDLCASLPADAVLPLSDGEPAGRLFELARLELERLGDSEGGSP